MGSHRDITTTIRYGTTRSIQWKGFQLDRLSIEASCEGSKLKKLFTKVPLIQVQQFSAHNSSQIGSDCDETATIRFYATRSFQKKGSRVQCSSKMYGFGHPKFDKPIPNMSENIIGENAKTGVRWQATDTRLTPTDTT